MDALAVLRGERDYYRQVSRNDIADALDAAIDIVNGERSPSGPAGSWEPPYRSSLAMVGRERDHYRRLPGCCARLAVRALETCIERLGGTINQDSFLDGMMG